MLVPTIGVEVHVELKSRKKVFSNSMNAYNAQANIYVNEIDYALPGTLPVLNKEVVNLALKACLACHCKINQIMHFDRKNYLYADLPKGYQITQKDTPIGYDGYLEIEVANQIKKIEIERIHIEEDTCKSIHTLDGTYLDFNRAGVPLIEIVTKPVIASGEEAMLYLEKLRETLLYLDITDAKIEEGSMRCDANVSLHEENSPLGVKTEIKNIGSITNVKTSIEYEINRQRALLEQGEKVQEETRRFDDKKNQTILMRSKETGNDYRYFGEPDIPEICISEEWLTSVKESLPLLPDDYRSVYRSHGVNENNLKTLIQNKSFAQFLYPLTDQLDVVMAANFLTGDILSYCNKREISLEETKLTPQKLLDFIHAITNQTISTKQAKELVEPLLQTEQSVKELIQEKGMTQICDQESLLKLIAQVLSENPQSVQDYKQGHDRALKYLMGQVMKLSGGKANPGIATELLTQELQK